MTPAPVFLVHINYIKSGSEALDVSHMMAQIHQNLTKSAGEAALSRLGNNLNCWLVKFTHKYTNTKILQTKKNSTKTH